MMNYQPPAGQTYQQLRFDLILNVEESGTVLSEPFPKAARAQDFYRSFVVRV